MSPCRSPADAAGNVAIFLAGLFSVSLVGWSIYTHYVQKPASEPPIFYVQPVSPSPSPAAGASPGRPQVVPVQPSLTQSQMVVKKLGGKDRMVATLRSAMQQMAAMGMTLRSASVGDVTQIKESQSQQFAIVPEFIDYTTGRGSMRMESFLLGISDDGGRNWTFIDGSGISSNPALLRELLPNLPADLVLPTR